MLGSNLNHPVHSLRLTHIYTQPLLENGFNYTLNEILACQHNPWNAFVPTTAQ